jgi:hypothetical protein
MPSQQEQDRIRELLALDEDELLVDLADKVVIGVGPLDPARKRTVARAWLEAQVDRLRDAICSDPGVQALRKNDQRDLLDLAVAVTDLVAGIVGAVPAATVSVLLVRQGLERLCG